MTGFRLAVTNQKAYNFGTDSVAPTHNCGKCTQVLQLLLFFHCIAIIEVPNWLLAPFPFEFMHSLSLRSPLRCAHMVRAHQLQHFVFTAPPHVCLRVAHMQCLH